MGGIFGIALGSALETNGRIAVERVQRVSLSIIFINGSIQVVEYFPSCEASVSLGQGLRWYYELCGSRGVCAVASFRVLGKPRELAVVPRQSDHRVHLRLDTSDFCAYRDVLIFKTKRYDPDIPGFIPKTIVDAGAHIGMASILFALRYPAARIVALEPEPSNFAALLRNTAPYKTIVAIQAALWRQDGEVALGPSNAHPKGAFQVVENGSHRVRAITMDTVMRETGIDSVDLLKVDIEGAEKEVFESCPWISKVRVLAIELHDRVRLGCSSTVKNAARDFQCDERGEVTFFVAEQSESGSYCLTDLPMGTSAPRSPAA
jgi:FkbM family methyltransferase